MRLLYMPNQYSQQRQKEKPASIYPVLMAMEAQYYRDRGRDVVWSQPYKAMHVPVKLITEPEGLPFLSLPRPDRVWTKAKSYTSGNYKHLPGTHIMSASGCSWGKCSFCVENGKSYEVRSVDDVIAEIQECKELGFKECFDDSATFPDGKWRVAFCNRVRDIGMHMGCNVRIEPSTDFAMLRDSGFRMLLFGVESANQKTLEKINKGVKNEDIIPTIKKAAKAGIETHIAVMFGYPWETEIDAGNTLDLVHALLIKGLAKTAQASLYRPPSGIYNKDHAKYVKRIYNAAFYPEFWYNQIKCIRTKEDLRYIWKGIRSWLKK